MRPGEEAAGSHLAIVDAGVDPAWAAAEVAASAFAGAGQSCGSLERVHVHRALAEPFLDALVARARALQGRPRARLRDRGRAADRRRAPACGCTARSRTPSTPAPSCWPAATPLPGRGFFYPPTVLAGAPDDALVICGETRGPVVTVRTVDSFAAALESDGRIGVASVLTPSHAHAQRAWRALPARTVSVNAVFRAPPPGAEPELLRRRHPHQGRAPLA